MSVLDVVVSIVISVCCWSISSIVSSACVFFSFLFLSGDFEDSFLRLASGLNIDKTVAFRFPSPLCIGTRVSSSSVTLRLLGVVRIVGDTSITSSSLETVWVIKNLSSFASNFLAVAFSFSDCCCISITICWACFNSFLSLVVLAVLEELAKTKVHFTLSVKFCDRLSPYLKSKTLCPY